MLKWTDYYGDVRQVELDIKEGLVTGYFIHDGPSCGIIFSHPILVKDLSKDQYWDTKQEAIKGTLKNLKNRLKELEAVKEYFQAQIKDMDNNSIFSLKQRIDGFKKRLKSK